jgi:DNA-binding MarR family transcriptional regulator
MALKYLSPLHRATRQIGLWFEEHLPDMIGTEGHMLTYLLPYGPCPVSDLVRVFGLKHSTMTSILDRLEKRGLIERTSNPSDRRSLLIGITRKGRTEATRVNALVEEIERAIDQRVSKRDLDAFRRVIKAVEEATEIQVRRSGS